MLGDDGWVIAFPRRTRGRTAGMAVSDARTDGVVADRVPRLLEPAPVEMPRQEPVRAPAVEWRAPLAEAPRGPGHASAAERGAEATAGGPPVEATRAVGESQGVSGSDVVARVGQGSVAGAVRASLAAKPPPPTDFEALQPGLTQPTVGPLSAGDGHRRGGAGTPAAVAPTQDRCPVEPLLEIPESGSVRRLVVSRGESLGGHSPSPGLSGDHSTGPFQR